MQKLTDSVGEGGKNARHDVALVQAALVLTERPVAIDPKKSKYLVDNIDGGIGKNTIAAIRLFQGDQVFVSPGGDTSQAVSGATPGRIIPGDTTYLKLAAAVPRPLADLRVLADSKLVYVAATLPQRDAQVSRVAQLTFERDFAASVVAVIKRLYDTTGIACGVCRKGDRRDFQTQYEIYIDPTNAKHTITKAGPGESNHNYGQAVDLGFEGLRWLRPNGTVVEGEDSWMHKLEAMPHGSREALFLWNAMRQAGTQQGLFPGPDDDRPHLQAWNDKNIDMADRLARLMSSVGTMKWTGKLQHYSCDFGIGGVFYSVGTAIQIWSNNALVTKTALTIARSQAPKTTNTTTQMKPIPRPSADTPRTTQVIALAKPKTTGALQTITGSLALGVTEADVAAMKEALHADFAAADAAWTKWTAR